MTTAQNMNCPAISLPDAVMKIQLIDDKAQGRLIEKSDLASMLNYNRPHGTYYERVSALTQYGLLETVGNQYRVSEIASKIRQYPQGHPERLKAIEKAALKPPLFEELHKVYGNKLPEDDELRSFIIKKVSSSKISDAIRAYRGTIEFINEAATASSIEAPRKSNTEVNMQTHTPKYNSTADYDRNDSSPTSSSIEKKGSELQLSITEDEVVVKFSSPVTSEVLPSEILQELIELLQVKKKICERREEARSKLELKTSSE